MPPEDIELHDKILRLLKGIVRAYEDWLSKKRTPEQTTT